MKLVPLVSRESAKLIVLAGKTARPVTVTAAPVRASTAATVRSKPVIAAVLVAPGASVPVKAAALLWASPSGDGGTAGATVIAEAGSMKTRWN